MDAFPDRDDLELWLSFIKSMELDLASRTVAFVFAKPVDHSQATLRYVESRLVLHSVREMDFLQNVNERATPEFHRSAVLPGHPNYSLRELEKLYYFGVDWGSEYCEWHFVAQGHDIKSLGNPVLATELEWVTED